MNKGCTFLEIDLTTFCVFCPKNEKSGLWWLFIASHGIKQNNIKHFPFFFLVLFFIYFLFCLNGNWFVVINRRRAVIWLRAKKKKKKKNFSAF